MTETLRQRQLRLHRRSGGTPTGSPPLFILPGLLFLHGARAELQHRVHRRHPGADAEPSSRWTSRRSAPASTARASTGAEIQSFGGAERVRRPRAGGQAGHRRQRHPGHRATRCGRRSTSVLGAGNYTIVRTEAVGPKVGGELRQKAFLAILLSFFAVLAYLAYRFEWRFGLAAVIATAHDILGDDRVHRRAAARGEPHGRGGGALDGRATRSTTRSSSSTGSARTCASTRRKRSSTILNRSINETLPRSVLTHGTTLSSLLALAIFGGEVIRPVRPGHVLRRVHRHVLVDLHRVAGAHGHREALARASSPGATSPAPAPPPVRQPEDRAGRLGRAIGLAADVELDSRFRC